MARPEITFHRLIDDLIKELRITAAELERAMQDGKGPSEVLSDLERRHAIHSGLSLRTTRKLRELAKAADKNVKGSGG